MACMPVRALSLPTPGSNTVNVVGPVRSAKPLLVAMRSNLAAILADGLLGHARAKDAFQLGQIAQLEDQDAQGLVVTA